ncbi:14984_t:CDS:2, partial [Cetraspora pellucida]
LQASKRGDEFEKMTCNFLNYIGADATIRKVPDIPVGDVRSFFGLYFHYYEKTQYIGIFLTNSGYTENAIHEEAENYNGKIFLTTHKHLYDLLNKLNDKFNNSNNNNNNDNMTIVNNNINNFTFEYSSISIKYDHVEKQVITINSKANKKFEFIPEQFNTSEIIENSENKTMFIILFNIIHSNDPKIRIYKYNNYYIKFEKNGTQRIDVACYNRLKEEFLFEPRKEDIENIHSYKIHGYFLTQNEFDSLKDKLQKIKIEEF